jgi:hypothetical protein
MAPIERTMEPAESTWRALGELLVAKGLLTADELELALEDQLDSGRPLGAVLVERGYVSGRALAVALAEQSGVELDTERGFGTGLWAEIDRRHRAGRGRVRDEHVEDGNVFRLEPVKLAAVGAAPDPELERLEAENRCLQAELERLQAEVTKPKLVEPPPAVSASHLLFVPTATRYVLVERDGPPPARGSGVDVSEAGVEGGFVVARIGRAPFPAKAEPRSCAFLLPRD